MFPLFLVVALGIARASADHSFMYPFFSPKNGGNLQLVQKLILMERSLRFSSDAVATITEDGPVPGTGTLTIKQQPKTDTTMLMITSSSPNGAKRITRVKVDKSSATIPLSPYQLLIWTHGGDESQRLACAHSVIDFKSEEHMFVAKAVALARESKQCPEGVSVVVTTIRHRDAFPTKISYDTLEKAFNQKIGLEDPMKKPLESLVIKRDSTSEPQTLDEFLLNIPDNQPSSGNTDNDRQPSGNWSDDGTLSDEEMRTPAGSSTIEKASPSLLNPSQDAPTKRTTKRKRSDTSKGKSPKMPKLDETNLKSHGIYFGYEIDSMIMPITSRVTIWGKRIKNLGTIEKLQGNLIRVNTNVKAQTKSLEDKDNGPQLYVFSLGSNGITLFMDGEHEVKDGDLIVMLSKNNHSKHDIEPDFIEAIAALGFAHAAQPTKMLSSLIALIEATHKGVLRKKSSYFYGMRLSSFMVWSNELSVSEEEPVEPSREFMIAYMEIAPAKIKEIKNDVELQLQEMRKPLNKDEIQS